jgi:nucleotide-binding universal stress UspA family protein
VQNPTRLVVQVDNDKGCADRVAYALAFAEKFGATLCGVFAKGTPKLPLVMDVAAGADLIEMQEQAASELAEKLRSSFLNIAADGVEVEWKVFNGDWARAIAQCARSADLLVMSQHDASDSAETTPPSLAADTIVSSGRPVLFVPYIGAKPVPPKVILVAWKDSREAARAVLDAIPYMIDAKVHVVSVGNEADPPDSTGPEVTNWLSSHGVDADFTGKPAGGLSVGDAILSRLGDMDVDLLVMGGYTHSRLREYVLGGTTKNLLEHTTVPVLMSH